MKVVFVLLALVVLNFASNEILNFLFIVPGGMQTITSNAMLPTFQPGSHYYVERISPYLNVEYKRGEVVAFYPQFLDGKNKNSWQKLVMAIERIKGSGSEPVHVRRVAGMPGDLIEIYCSSVKMVFPNNVIPATAESPQGGKVIKIRCRTGNISQPETICAGKYVVPPGFLFLIGDSTEYMGFVEKSKVTGKIQFLMSKKIEIIEPEEKDEFIISVFDARSTDNKSNQ